MTVLAYLLCISLCVIGAIHFLWAMGSTWPCKDEVTLAKTVVGTRGVEKMPPRWASMFVAACMVAAGIWALELRGRGPVNLSQVVAFVGGLGLAAAFSMRGILGVFPAFEKMSPEQPFLRLNRRVYSPLSFLIGVGFALLVLAMPNWGWRLGG